MDMYQKREIRKNKKMDENTKSLPSNSINWYPGHMAKTKRLISENIDFIDVIYEVIDARMPYSSRIREIDQILKNKPRILIMTKIDMCDINETNKWVKYYEANGLKVIKINLENNSNVNTILKATDEIMEVTNNKRENKGLLRKKCRALVMGIPNVGKSTLINRLVGKSAVGVGNRPGVTKQTSWIRISNKIELFDTPGILWPKFEDENIAYNLAALTAIREEVLPVYDVAYYILRMLDKYYTNELNRRYGLESLFDDMYENFEFIGKKRGCLIKGGEVDYDKVVNVIFNDIKTGAIKNITFDRFEVFNAK